MIRRRSVLTIALVVAAGCGGSSAKGPTAAVTAPPTTAATTTTTLPVEDQVKAAYLHSWDVYADAVRRLDASHLAEVFAESQLEIATTDVHKLTERHRAVRVSIEHDLHFHAIDATTALIRDDEVNHSVEFDPATGEPVEPDPNERFSESNTLRFSEGMWKVTAVIRQR